MRYWDSSALLPLILEEPRSDALNALYTGDPEALVWWATPVECASAIARVERDGRLSRPEATAAFRALDGLMAACCQVEPLDEVRETARRLLRVHPLRTGDALQLAAAYLAAERRPRTLGFVTLDDRLADAAAREGFPLADIARR